jgi:hypothetical protein
MSVCEQIVWRAGKHFQEITQNMFHDDGDGLNNLRNHVQHVFLHLRVLQNHLVFIQVNNTILISPGHIGKYIRYLRWAREGHLAAALCLVMRPMHILCLPDLCLRTPYTVLPRPNVIDQWLRKSNMNSYGNKGDIPSDQVLCTVQLVTSTVRHLRLDLSYPI